MRRGGVDWIDLAQDRDRRRSFVNMATNLRVAENVEEFLSNCATGSF
jgi:hypothetical protein